MAEEGSSLDGLTDADSFAQHGRLESRDRLLARKHLNLCAPVRRFEFQRIAPHISHQATKHLPTRKDEYNEVSFAYALWYTFKARSAQCGYV